MNKVIPVKLGSVADILVGYAFKSAGFSQNHNDVFLVKGSNISHRKIDYDAGPWWREDQNEDLSKYELQENDVILAMDRPIVGDQLKFCWIKRSDPKSFLVQRVARLRGSDSLDTNYLRCVIAHDEFQKYVDSITTGANVPHISGPDIKDYQFPLPPLPIQKKIAGVLSAYDDLIEANLKRIKLLEEMAQITYEEWFVRLRFPNHETTSIDPKTGLPEGWVHGVLGDVVAFRNGYAFKSDTYSDKGAYKIVTIRNVQDGSFAQDTNDQTDLLPPNLKPHHHLKTGDILMSLTGNVGRVCVVIGQGYLLNQRVAKLEPKNSFSPMLAYCFLRDKGMLTQLESISNGAAQQNLSPINAANLKVNVPPLSVVETFNAKFGDIFTLCCNLNIQNTFLKEARDLLLPRLITGLIDIDDYLARNGSEAAAA
ncbi:restriction endonuclease subunit S [Agrobacterium vaccinii]|uniref:restriction endonuclease subunit S n=1 Tax=Agrobacterium vaccinii TaxID=2735528 RepID=UPI001E6394E8|nr:restriction endonuclease subunit S [Agrobacterium vaccinii]UHS59188.1 restriction endonuclease subunit S [Agrobacterium vaccinii]